MTPDFLITFRYNSIKELNKVPRTIEVGPEFWDSIRYHCKDFIILGDEIEFYGMKIKVNYNLAPQEFAVKEWEWKRV